MVSPSSPQEGRSAPSAIPARQSNGYSGTAPLSYEADAVFGNKDKMGVMYPSQGGTPAPPQDANPRHSATSPHEPLRRERTHSTHSTHSRQSIRSFIGDTPSMIGIPEKGTRGKMSVAIVLYKTITGAGALAMPYAFYKSGKVLFPLMVLFVTLCSHYGCLLIARALDLVGRGDLDFAELGRVCIGRAGFTLAMAVCFFDSWGATVASFRMIAELVLPVLERYNAFGEYHDLPPTDAPEDLNLNSSSSFDNPSVYSYGFIIGILAVVIYPALLYKKVTELGFISLLGVIAMFVFVVTVLVKAITDPHDLSEVSSFNWDANAVVAIPIIAFSYDCQANVFGSYRDISGVVGDKSGKLIVASAWANGAAAVSYIALAFCGYIAFTTSVDQNVMKNFDSSTLLDIIKIFFALSVLLSFPVILIECSTIVREHVVIPQVIKFLKRCNLLGYSNDAPGQIRSPSPEEDETDERDRMLRKGVNHRDGDALSAVPALEEGKVETFIGAMTSVFILGSAAVMAAAVPSMYDAFTYVGATTATMNTAVLPPLFYLMTVKKLHPQFSIFGTWSETGGLLKRASSEGIARQYIEDEASNLLMVPAPPSPIAQWCAFLFLICGIIAIPTLIYVVAATS